MNHLKDNPEGKEKVSGQSNDTNEKKDRDQRKNTGFGKKKNISSQDSSDGSTGSDGWDLRMGGGKDVGERGNKSAEEIEQEETKMTH